MYTWIKSTTCIARAVKYPMTDKPDQKDALRIEGMRCGGGLLDTGRKQDIVRQFQEILHSAGRARKKDLNGEYPVQGYTITYSFSKDELDPDDPDSIEKALDIAEDATHHMTKTDDVKYIMIAQKDGEGGCVHVHEVKCAVHTDTLKPLQGREIFKAFLEEQADAALQRHGIVLDTGKSHPKRDKKRKKQNAGATKDGAGWMDELQSKIHIAASVTTTPRDFEGNLRELGVTVSKKDKPGWTYVLAESEHSEFVGKKARYTRFTEDFSQPTLNKQFEENYKLQQKRKAEAKKEQPKAEPPKPAQKPRNPQTRRLPDISFIQPQTIYDDELGELEEVDPLRSRF